MGKIAQSLKEGYEKFVIKKEGCWDWKGCCPKNPGYGQFRSQGKLFKSHRASWELNFGKIPEGMSVLHKCDNRKCSNPEHLFLGTQKENMLDAISKRRTTTVGVKDVENHRTKLFRKDYWKIFKLLDLEFSQKEIAEIFQVNRSTIKNTISKRCEVGY